MGRISMQEKVREFIEEYALSCNEKIRYIDLVSEIGELGKEILRQTDYGEKHYQVNERSVEEMGDCLFSILALCCEMNINADDALNYAMNKYKKRYISTGTISSNGKE